MPADQSQPPQPQPPQIGDKIRTWFSGQADHMSTVMAVKPYAGRYKGLFTWDVQVTAPRTEAGFLWMSIRDDWTNEWENS